MPTDDELFAAKDQAVEAESPPPAQREPGAPERPEVESDDTNYPYKVGGIRIQSELAGARFATLGCVMEEVAEHPRYFALTTYSSLLGEGKLKPTKGETRVGQPKASNGISGCCSKMIGTFAFGDIDNTRDAALVQLKPGLDWMAEIFEIGLITGVHDITDDEANSKKYEVRIRGARSKLTGGTVEVIEPRVIRNKSYPRIIVVKPNCNAHVPTNQKVIFGAPEDEGSLLVNNKGEAVGLYIFTDPADTQNRGLAIPIHGILGAFNQKDGVLVKIAQEPIGGTVHTVPSATVAIPAELTTALTGRATGETVRVPVGSPWLPTVPQPTAELMAPVQNELARSASGRVLVSLWSRHATELLRLVREQRRVAVAWHRNCGPALLQMCVRMVTQPDLAMPRTVNGEPPARRLEAICEAFSQFASDALRQDLDRARAVLPDVAGLTYPQIVAALAAGEGLRESHV